MDIRNPRLRDKAQELLPEPIECTMKVSNLTAGLRVTEAVIRLSVSSDSIDQ